MNQNSPEPPFYHFFGGGVDVCDVHDATLTSPSVAFTYSQSKGSFPNENHQDLPLHPKRWFLGTCHEETPEFEGPGLRSSYQSQLTSDDQMHHSGIVPCWICMGRVDSGQWQVPNVPQRSAEDTLGARVRVLGFNPCLPFRRRFFHLRHQGQPLIQSLQFGVSFPSSLLESHPDPTILPATNPRNRTPCQVSPCISPLRCKYSAAPLTRTAICLAAEGV